MQADSVVAATMAVPGGLGTILAAGALCGAIGAFAGDLAADAGKLERWKRESNGWTLGFVGKIVVGAVAAVLVLSLNPPGNSWLALIGTALAAGVGGDAVVTGFVATGRAEASE